MNQTQENLLDQLLSTARSLSIDKLVEVLDFAAYLHTRPPALSSQPERGSAQALLRHVGAFRFAAGEIDRLLDDIAQMRKLDMEGHA